MLPFGCCKGGGGGGGGGDGDKEDALKAFMLMVCHLAGGDDSGCNVLVPVLLATAATIIADIAMD